MGRRVLEVILALVVGAVAVAIVFGVVSRRDASTLDQRADDAVFANEGTIAPPTTRAPADVDAFLLAWQTAFELDVVVIGREEVLRVDPAGGVDPLTVVGEVTGEIEIRRVRLGDRRIEQIGEGALVTDALGQRSCDRYGIEFLCTDPTVTPTIEQELSEFVERLVGDDPPYDLFDDGGGCWRAVAVEPSPLVRWGQISIWCFDPETGALARTAIWRGEDKVQRFQATEIRTDVAPRDLEPQ